MTEALHPADWLALAADDLAAARALASLPPGFPAKVCFLAQQCAERAIKAVLLHLGAAPPRSHDPAELLAAARAAGADVPADVLAASELAPYAVQFRYSVLDAVSPEDARAALHHAAATLAWAQTRAQPLTPNP